MDFGIVAIHFLLYFIIKIHAARYQFFFDNEAMFDKCPHLNGSNGIHDLFDLTKLNLTYSEGSLHCSGNATTVWDVQPSDRIELHCEVFKYERGGWQPTVLSFTSKDFCQMQFDKNSFSYQIWSKNIPEEERLCVNNYGVTYHYIPFSIETIFDILVNIEGRHKVVSTFVAYENGIKPRPNKICFQYIGEFVKV
ncbi:uncharacterized protein [Musca autumnalis]|uniref:uncharacterized protein n=1 Tax=Musca autumnalis TaxID=221902 RepID=UPI003CF59F22